MLHVPLAAVALTLLIGSLLVGVGIVGLTLLVMRQSEASESEDQPDFVETALVRHHAHGPRSGALWTTGHTSRNQPGQTAVYGKRRTPIEHVVDHQVGEYPPVRRLEDRTTQHVPSHAEVMAWQAQQTEVLAGGEVRRD